jgi:hypothetical protein
LDDFFDVLGGITDASRSSPWFAPCHPADFFSLHHLFELDAMVMVKVP